MLARRDFVRPTGVGSPPCDGTSFPSAWSTTRTPRRASRSVRPPSPPCCSSSERREPCGDRAARAQPAPADACPQAALSRKAATMTVGWALATSVVIPVDTMQWQSEKSLFVTFDGYNPAVPACTTRERTTGLRDPLRLDARSDVVLTFCGSSRCNTSTPETSGSGDDALGRRRQAGTHQERVWHPSSVEPLGEAAIVEPGPPTNAGGRPVTAPRDRRAKIATPKEQMAQAPADSCPHRPRPNEGGVRPGSPPRVRWRLAARPPGALKRKLARAAPGGRDDEPAAANAHTTTKGAQQGAPRSTA